MRMITTVNYTADGTYIGKSSKVVTEKKYKAYCEENGIPYVEKESEK